MKVWSVTIPIWATVYIKAETEEAALAAAKGLSNDGIELREDEGAEIPITGCQYDDPDLPDVSMSPAMTIGEVDPKEDDLELAYDPDEDEEEEPSID